MSHYSFRNKNLVEFPNGKLMLFCEVSDSSLRGDRGERVWSKHIMHPDGSLFYTKDTLKAAQTDYVEKQLRLLKEHRQWEVEKGYAAEYVEPSLDSYDTNGTVFPGGSRIRNGKSFYSGRPKKAEEFFAKWDAPRWVILSNHNNSFNERYDILAADLDEWYQDAVRQCGTVYLGVR